MLTWTALAIAATMLAIAATMLATAGITLANAATMPAIAAVRSGLREKPRRPARSGEGAVGNQVRFVEPTVEPELSHPLSLARGSPGKPAWLTQPGHQMGCDITVTSMLPAP
jgi:hypothetical protein